MTISLFFCLSFSSCIPNKKLLYINNDSLNYTVATLIPNENPPYLLKPGDILNVRVKTLDQQSSSYFNIQSDNLLNLNPAGLYINSYSLNKSGIIELPEIGEVHLEGYSVEEAQIIIKEKMQGYLNDATILVKLVSFKITVLGEVRNPGSYFVYNDQLNIFEGLGLAGDLTDFGNRANITLIRQNSAGSEAILINLTKADILSSDYYFLQPNDVLYVQLLKAKSLRGNVNTLNVLGVLFGAISSTILVLNYLNNN